MFRSALYDDVPGLPDETALAAATCPSVRACLASAAVTAVFNTVNHPNDAAVTYLSNACAKEAEARMHAAANEMRRYSLAGPNGGSAMDSPLPTDSPVASRRGSNLGGGSGLLMKPGRGADKPPPIGRFESTSAEPASPRNASGPQDVSPLVLVTRMLAAATSLAAKPAAAGACAHADLPFTLQPLCMSPPPAEPVAAAAAHRSLQELLTSVISIAATACGTSLGKNQGRESSRHVSSAAIAAARTLHDHALLSQLAHLCDTYACRCA